MNLEIEECPRCMSPVDIEDSSLSFLGDGKLILQVEVDCSGCSLNRMYQTSLT